MHYQEFLETVTSLVCFSIPQDTKAELTQVLKNNDTRLDALTFRTPDSDVSPTIYLNPFYQNYLNGADPRDIAEEIVHVWEGALPAATPDLSFFSDYEKVKPRLVYKLVNQKQNRELLSETPWCPFLDLAIVFYCLLSEDTQGNATILIRSKHCEIWNVDAETLLTDAQENTPFLLAPEIRSMREMLPPLLFPPEADEDHFPPLYVLTNRLKLNGAACLLYDHLLQDFSERIDSDFYILPSSVHEVILMPAKSRTDDDALSSMVCDVNRTQVSSEEYLSDHVYFYSRSERQICL